MAQLLLGLGQYVSHRVSPALQLPRSVHEGLRRLSQPPGQPQSWGQFDWFSPGSQLVSPQNEHGSLLLMVQATVRTLPHPSLCDLVPAQLL